MNTTTLEDRIKARIEELKAERELKRQAQAVDRLSRVTAIDAEYAAELQPLNVAIGELTALIDGKVAS